jgi:hypothetical protein
MKSGKKIAVRSFGSGVQLPEDASGSPRWREYAAPNPGAALAFAGKRHQQPPSQWLPPAEIRTAEESRIGYGIALIRSRRFHPGCATVDSLHQWSSAWLGRSPGSLRNTCRQHAEPLMGACTGERVAVACAVYEAERKLLNHRPARLLHRTPPAATIVYAYCSASNAHANPGPDRRRAAKMKGVEYRAYEQVTCTNSDAKAGEATTVR